MDLIEAMKLLNDAGYDLYLQGSCVYDTSCLSGYENDEMKEAWRCCAKAGYIVAMEISKFSKREARLKKEFEVATKAPKDGEHCGEPVSGTPLNATEALKEKHKDNKNTAKNPALNESASQFNDAMLDEQAKKIKRLEDYVASRNKIIAEQSAKISSLNAKVTKKNKVISKKSRELKDKDAVLSDVAEELRLSKVREEKLTEVCKKYLKEIDVLKGGIRTLDELRERELEELEKAKKHKTSNRRKSIEAVASYVDAVTKAELDGLFLDYWENDGNKITAIYQKNNGKELKLCLDFTGDEIVFSCHTIGEKDYNAEGQDTKPTCDNIENKDDELDKILKRYLMTGVFVCPKGFSFSLKDFYKKLDEPVLACGLTQEEFFKKMKDIINSEL